MPCAEALLKAPSLSEWKTAGYRVLRQAAVSRDKHLPCRQTGDYRVPRQGAPCSETGSAVSPDKISGVLLSPFSHLAVRNS